MAVHEDFLRGSFGTRGEACQGKSNHGAVLGGTGCGSHLKQIKGQSPLSHSDVFGAVSGVKEDGGRATASRRHCIGRSLQRESGYKPDDQRQD
jgi:hypothetical protein